MTALPSLLPDYARAGESWWPAPLDRRDPIVPPRDRAPFEPQVRVALRDPPRDLAELLERERWV